MKKILLFSSIFIFLSNVNAQKVNQHFGSSTLPPTGWTLTDTYGILSIETPNAYGSASNVGSVRGDYYNSGYGINASLETYSFSSSVSGDSLRFDIAYADFDPTYTDSFAVLAYVGSSYVYLREWLSSQVSDTGMTTASASLSQYVPASTEWRTKIIALPIGTTKIQFQFMSGYGNELYIDNVVVDSFVSTVTQTFDSVTCIQTFNNPMVQGRVNQKVMQIPVKVTGSVSPMSVTFFSLSTTGTTNASSEIDSAKIFFTGSSPTFSTTNKFGAVGSPNGAFSISGSQALSDGFNYFWLTYDIKSGAGSGSDVDATGDFVLIGGSGQTPNVTAPAGVYHVVTPLSGAYTVGSAGNYSTLTAAINDLNLRGVNGTTTLNLTNTLYSTGTGETFPITITGFDGASSTNSLTIKPLSAGTVISGNASSMINLKGARYVTINGAVSGSSKDLTIADSNSASAAILISSLGSGLGSTNDTISNIIIKGGGMTNTGTYGIFLGGTAVGTGGNNNDAIGIIGDSIYNVYTGIGNITSNVSNNAGLFISNNGIGNSNPAASIGFYGLNLSNVTGASISGNTITNVRASSATPSAVKLAASTSTIISKNIINGVAYTGTGGYGARGIYVSGTLDTGISIVNNFITNIVGDGDGTTTTASYYLTYDVFGIILEGGGNHQVYYNNVWMNGNRQSGSFASGVSACLFIPNSGLTGLNIRNNIFQNTQTSSNIPPGTNYDVYSVTNAAGFTAQNYNDLVDSSTTSAMNIYTGYFNGSNQATLTAWKTATGKEANSVSVPVNFVSTSDLHLTGTSIGNLNLSCLPAGGITTDIDGQTRFSSVHYMGADEIPSSPLPVTMISFTATKKSPDVLLSWVTVSEINNSHFLVERSLNGIDFTTINTIAGNGNTNRNIDYHYTDANAEAFANNGTVYYRLIQVDINGTSTLSQIVYVDFSGKKIGKFVSYPNPFSNSVTLNFDAIEKGNVTVTLTNLQGSTIFEKTLDAQKGDNTKEISELSSISEGVYFLKVTLNGDSKVFKLFKAAN